ncbi:MAG: CRISPR-associated endoribonuclease Cas6 [Lachnospiraceae bacterium]|nr:CRISPR-associated endoribonuclease Cas6 [Lachnospiraceae bacterium]
MQLVIQHNLPTELVLPINYQYVIQGMIYNSLRILPGYAEFLHNYGYDYGDRQFRMFTFSRLKGKYNIEGNKIIFKEHISFEVRSPEVLLLKVLKATLEQNGIQYQDMKYYNVSASLKDDTIECDELKIRMMTPIVAYETDIVTKKTHYFDPYSQEFYDRVQKNLRRKYFAFTGSEVLRDVELLPVKVQDRDKCVTKYKGFYITGWCGEYVLKGERKYLDFLYQTGIGSKNAQGFGMFEIE